MKIGVPKEIMAGETRAALIPADVKRLVQKNHKVYIEAGTGVKASFVDEIYTAVGANDVINPAARAKKDSALYGMPILNVDQAKTVIIIKRSLSAGFAGEDNDLFYDPKTMMVLGDGKKMLSELLHYLKG